jgi:hypothetical protein
MKHITSINYKGFNALTMSLEDFLEQCADRERLEIVKVDGAIFLYRESDNCLYMVSEPQEKEA